jgi:hypothetical protein
MGRRIKTIVILASCFTVRLCRGLLSAGLTLGVDNGSREVKLSALLGTSKHRIHS